MLAFRSPSETAAMLRCPAWDAAETVRAPGPNNPPARAQAARNTGTKTKYRRWDDKPKPPGVCFQYRRVGGVAGYSKGDKYVRVGRTPASGRAQACLCLRERSAALSTS